MFSQIIGAIGQRKGQIADEGIDEEGKPFAPPPGWHGLTLD